MDDSERMHQAHDEILDRVAKLASELERHVGTVHSELMIRSDIEASDRKVEAQVRAVQMTVDEIGRQVGDIADLVLGPKVFDFDGEPHRDGGLAQITTETAHALKEMSSDYRNGGIRTEARVTLSPGAWGAVVAIIGALSAIAVALIQSAS